MNRTLLLLAAIGTSLVSGCKYQDIHECDPDLQLAIDGTVLYGIDVNISGITARVHEEVPEDERLISTEQVLENVLANKVSCGIPFEQYEEGGDLQGSYLEPQQIVVIEENTLMSLLETYNFESCQTVLDLYSKSIAGNYVLDKEKMKDRLREEDDLTEGFVSLMHDIRELYEIFSKVGDTIFHENTHMTLHLNNLPYNHEDSLADHLVNEHGWAVRDEMVDQKDPAIKLALEAYDEVQGEGR